jgi:hypothetical protein
LSTRSSLLVGRSCRLLRLKEADAGMVHRRIFRKVRSCPTRKRREKLKVNSSRPDFMIGAPSVSYYLKSEKDLLRTTMTLKYNLSLFMDDLPMG